jgi:hypothetical protein
LRLKEYNVDTTDDQSLDLLLIHKATKEDIKMETPSGIKTTHTLLNLKLRHDLQEAKEDMNNFIVDTSLEINKGELVSTISWGWMAAISGIILIFLSLFIVKISRSCKESRHRQGIGDGKGPKKTANNLGPEFRQPLIKKI